jgi:hypothetical protein
MWLVKKKLGYVDDTCRSNNPSGVKYESKH